MYPMDYIDQLPRMGDHDHSMSMSYGVGRSYRYYRGEVLMCGESPCGAFGYGMSLTTFNLSCDPVHTHVNAQQGDADPPSPPEPARCPWKKSIWLGVALKMAFIWLRFAAGSSVMPPQLAQRSSRSKTRSLYTSTKATFTVRTSSSVSWSPP